MIRIAAIVVTLALLLGAAFYVGTRWDEAADERDKAETLERIQDADTSKGDAKEDRAWIVDFLDGMRPSD